ncbi:WD40 repeat-like protein [Pluteus cervinus]|uniref:WD40 repeat-like protein n=1 Tax=Pluteus cervinus TaxID=181527 RepID=A0ACD3BE91_9AGAR|nr:WD40 repeat-like protein [Pluteus cervinus]
MAQTIYVSAATNRFSHAADISASSLIAFGSSNLVCIWDPSVDTDAGVSETLLGHEGRVTAIRFVTNETFISADNKGVLLLWKKVDKKWVASQPLQAHKQSISAICVVRDFVVTGASDSLVKVWTITSGDDGLREIQSISLNGRYALALALTRLPQSEALLLAIGSTGREVQLWVRSDDVFVRSAVLSGHEDWVRGLSFQEPISPEGPLILASGSQDSTIRLWNIELWKKQATSVGTLGDGLSDELLDAFEESLGDMGDEEGGRQISLKRHMLTVKSEDGSRRYSVAFDALLLGHDAGITSLQWRPGTKWGSPFLSSTSTDSSVILWTPSSSEGTPLQNTNSIWINRQRFGDVGGQRLGGFVGGLWAKGGAEMLAWGWSGGWRRWRCDSTDLDRWEEHGAISGHSGSVRGIDWNPAGEYLFSTGLDQTTRIHAPLTNGGEIRWHEIARPQVHGYDLLNIVLLNPLKFASIADEKVIRVFEAPRNFVDLVETLNVAKFSEEEHGRPMAANVPPLGLSNKATGTDASPTHNAAVVDKRRPFEGELAAVTLWPEIEKVFGHGYESITLAVSNSRQLIATACKATTAEHAVIRIYDTQKFHPVGEPLVGHALTITRIAFSPDDNFILSVSRDRSWRLFERQPTGEYAPITSDKSHARIIWDCAWAKEGDVFATASRDKLVKIWAPGDKKLWSLVATIKLDAAATAVDFAPVQDGQRRLAIGLETGEILIYRNDPILKETWMLDTSIERRIAHVDHIHRLAWRPTTANQAQELASCSEDGTLKILKVQMATG